MADKIDVWVYAHWRGMSAPKLIGILSAHQAKGKKAFSFSYDKEWITTKEQLLLDPDIAWFGGHQYPTGKENFGIFMDSMPDTWGRTLMRRRAAIFAQEQGKKSPVLYDIDFLLGVHDMSRMGALRFKTAPEGDFLDNDPIFPTPPWSSIRELQYGASLIESNENANEVKKWLAMLMAPGSSLGGARPKANILDEQGHPWIAKFPSKNDTIDKGAWEYLAYQLAVNAGIAMAESKIEKVAGKYHTFFTKRFDRQGHERIHFASAMTMTGKNEDLIRDEAPSYLDIVEFIQFSGATVVEDLHQIWRRMIFNIFISNTDDHLRNHGFILKEEGWRLSPAFDINPSVDKNGLALNIDMDNNALNIDLAKSVGQYFRLGVKEMNIIIDEVQTSVSTWERLANEIGITRSEQMLMRRAFML
ncbi:type II toxin-antitoxin system HipA family toxin [Mucilaginibacter paludis]|uniref:HipA domain protein n=1 Tax=Mucilaginibacter paludis DSM 18603 TaxID=714943 RepID=H1Y4T1_9SPHI|nr:type II toxin-antitoxin system HipA family toxin [Mucilaginibacter paludis]EHQ28125.1 HipA domain protein [Mucilaginibacter paludis DSM 18603]